MYNPIDIAERIKKTAKNQNVQTTEMLVNCKLSKNTISSMLAGSTPKSENLAKIADELNVSVDYLLGRTDDPAIHYLNEKQFKLVARGGKNIDTTSKNTPTDKTPRTTKK